MLAWWLAEHQEDVAAATQAAAEHGAEHAVEHGSKVPELPNLIGLLHNWLGNEQYGNPAVADSLDNTIRSIGFFDPLGSPFTAFENILYMLIIITFLSILFYFGYRSLRVKPPEKGRISRLAMFTEVLFVFFEDFFAGILGKKDVHKHLPLVGTLFIYIFCCNALGLIFLGKAPTANLSFNLAMSLLVFLYVHFTAIKKSFWGYLKHYPGDLPSLKELGVIGYFLLPFLTILFTFIHIMEAIIQPISLALRLYGNILGKDALLGVFGALIMIPVYGGISVAFPTHTPFLFLGLLLGTIQALIFSLLTAVYITLWFPHVKQHAEEHA
ncbi:F0F1 ATP synthase subunit A [bacterium]|nr:F0F1 ATP synthase subunit A [bacterium]